MIKARILPVLKRFFGQVFMMNIGRAKGHPEVIAIYKRRILTGLSRSQWVVVVLSRNAATSAWVKFEFGWALRHHDHRRITALIIDDEGYNAFLPVLKFVRTVHAPETSPKTERAIERALKRSGAKESKDPPEFFMNSS
jgi:hypothetical protein